MENLIYNCKIDTCLIYYSWFQIFVQNCVGEECFPEFKTQILGCLW